MFYFSLFLSFLNEYIQQTFMRACSVPGFSPGRWFRGDPDLALPAWVQRLIGSESQTHGKLKHNLNTPELPWRPRGYRGGARSPPWARPGVPLARGSTGQWDGRQQSLRGSRAWVTVASESLPLGETNLSKLFEALILSGYFRGRKLVQDHNLCCHEDQGQGTSAESPSLQLPGPVCGHCPLTVGWWRGRAAEKVLVHIIHTRRFSKMCNHALISQDAFITKPLELGHAAKDDQCPLDNVCLINKQMSAEANWVTCKLQTSGDISGSDPSQRLL